MAVTSVSSLHLNWCAWEMGPILQQERIQRKHCSVYHILTSLHYWLICVPPYHHNVICRTSLNRAGGNRSFTHNVTSLELFQHSSSPLSLLHVVYFHVSIETLKPVKQLDTTKGCAMIPVWVLPKMCITYATGLLCKWFAIKHSAGRAALYYFDW